MAMKQFVVTWMDKNGNQVNHKFEAEFSDHLRAMVIEFDREFDYIVKIKRLAWNENPETDGEIDGG
jgi:hypothetical protein